MRWRTMNSARVSSASVSKMYKSGLVNPVSSKPAGRSTRKHSRQTGARSGQKTFDTGLKTRSKLLSAKALRSRMSPSTVLMTRPSRAATSSSRASCRGELSNTVTSAPAAASTGPCCPPPEARHSTEVPLMSAGNQSRGTGSYPMSTTDQSPARARAVTSGPTGRVHSFPRSTSRSQAARLYATGSRFSVTSARLASPACHGRYASEAGGVQGSNGASRRTKIVVDPGYAVVLVHYRPPNQPRSPNQPCKGGIGAQGWRNSGLAGSGG